MVGENVGYLILCKGCFIMDIEGEWKCYYVFEELISLNILLLLLELFVVNVVLVKIEGC